MYLLDPYYKWNIIILYCFIPHLHISSVDVNRFAANQTSRIPVVDVGGVYEESHFVFLASMFFKEGEIYLVEKMFHLRRG